MLDIVGHVTVSGEAVGPVEVDAHLLTPVQERLVGAGVVQIERDEDEIRFHFEPPVFEVEHLIPHSWNVPS
jgi:hypothetical protein